MNEDRQLGIATRGRIGVFAAVLVLSAAFSLDSLAQRPLAGTAETMDTRALGLGGATRSTASSTTGLYLNPATIAMARLYHINLMYQFTGEEDLHMGGAAIVDSVTSSKIAAGLALNYTGNNLKRSDFERWDARLAMAGNFGDVFFLGMTGRYLRVESDLEGGDRGPNGKPAMPASGSQQVDGFTFDAGAAVRILNLVSIGVTGYNLTNTESIYAPIKLGSGAGLTLFEMLLIEADVVLDFTSFDKPNQQINSGVEVFLGGRVPLRVGYIYDVHYDLNTITAGIGYTDTAFAVDFGYQQEIVDRGRFMLSFGIRIFIG